jgi:cytochrome c biogenesis protein CcdA
MRDAMGIFLSLMFMSLGALLVYEGDFSVSDLTQTARIISGALFLALGLTVLPIILMKYKKSKPVPRNLRSSRIHARRR